MVPKKSKNNRVSKTSEIFNAILDGVRGSKKASPSLTLPFGVWQQWNLVVIELGQELFKTTKN